MKSEQLNSEQLYERLENLAQQLGISIRYENLSASTIRVRSGLCKVKGRSLYIMDSSKALGEKIRLLKECLSQMDLEGVYVLPAVRRFLEGGDQEGTGG